MKKEIYKPLDIPDCKGRRFAVGDIHGCFLTFKKLVEEKLQLTTDDQLFLLGDFINRGPASKEVLDYIIDLLRDDYQVIPIRGNHENKLLRAYDQGILFLEEFLVHYNSTDLFDDLSLYIDFCAQLPYYVELPNFFLSHIGFSQTVPTPSTDLRLMFPETIFAVDFRKIKEKHLIHGHIQDTLYQIKMNAKNKATVFSIDNGCYNLGEEGLGHLCALNLDNFQVTFQRNVEVYPKIILNE